MKEKIRTKNGYAVGVECPRGHAGNQRFAWSSPGTWQCQGCGFLATSDWVRRQQEAAAAKAGE